MASNYKAVGRIYTLPGSTVGTAWILSDGRLVTAAHVFDAAGDGTYIEFNVPYSPDCNTLGHPSTKDKYIINMNSIVKSPNHSVGNDWAIFSVYPNSQTGLTPIEAQNTYYFVEQTTTPDDLQLIGFGSSSTCSKNYAQQSGTGSYYGLSGTILEYVVDATGGNSGSPVINMATGKVIGIHTTGNCSNGYNEGTSTYNNSFWSALHLPSINVTVDEKLSNGTRVGTIGRWQGSSFSPRVNPGSSISVNPGSIEALQGDQVIYSSQKYNNWTQNSNLDTNVINHHPFVVRYSDNNYTANFLPTYSGITVQNNFPELSSNPANSLVGLSDPWLIDYADPNYGNVTRNEGTLAPFRQQASPFSPNLSSSYNGYVYKGLFLNQSGPTKNWIVPYYSVNVPNQIISIGGINHSPYLWYWTGTNAVFKNSNTSPTPVVFTNSNAVVTANAKLTQLSTDVSAFSNNSQRRLIETQSGGATWLHLVYTSLGHVWIEHSSNGGGNWIVGNNGQPLDGTTGSKCPSIAFTHNSNYNYIGVVWEQPSGSHYAICGKIFNQYIGSSDVPHPVDEASYTIFTEPSDAYDVNANPNLELAGGAFGPYFITFERKSTSGSLQPGINWVVGYIEDSGTAWDGAFGGAESNGIVSGTNASTINVQMSPYPDYINSNYVSVNLLRQQGSPGKIYSHYLYLYKNGGSWQYSQYDDGMISYNANLNFSPSIVSLADYVYASCWIEYSDMTFYFYDNSVRYYFGSSGSNAQSCSINRGGGNSNSGFAAWSQHGSSWSNKSIRFDNGIPVTSSIFTLSTAGKYIQAGNGAGSDLSNMYTESFYPFSSPYYFVTSSSLTPLSKSNSVMAEGRGFTINKGNISFNYRFANLNVDGKYIGFVDVPDTLDFSDTEVLSNALVTEPFQIYEDSKVSFSELSGFTDSALAAVQLGKNGFINFTLELIDDITGKVIAKVRNGNLNSANTYSVRNFSYLLNTNGVAGKIVTLRISVESNLIEKTKGHLAAGDLSNIPDKLKERFNAQRSNLILTKSFNEVNEIVNKDAANKLDIPTTYALFQNYPNPFNPSTTISYQIPKDGFVTLKIYDILGREITTLVNEFETKGKYNSSFNAENLASGVYLYQLKVNEFSSTKKLLLMK